MTNFVTLDDFDHRLLARVRRNNLEPARITAEAVGLSESAVLRRLRRLRAEGVIAADVAVIDPARVEPRIVLHVQVEMNTQDRGVMDAFQRAMKASPEVQGAWDVTGETDYLLTVAVRSSSGAHWSRLDRHHNNSVSSALALPILPWDHPCPGRCRSLVVSTGIPSDHPW